MKENDYYSQFMQAIKAHPSQYNNGMNYKLNILSAFCIKGNNAFIALVVTMFRL